MSVFSENIKWNFKPLPAADKVNGLSRDINTDPIVSSLLLQRGIENFDSARMFFAPDFSMLHDPFLMKDMDRATGRVIRAIQNNEKILIFGDYDVDGTCSVAMVYAFLKKKYENLYYYIPDRYKEGYGVSFAGIDFAAELGVSLIIALDCGIRSVDKVEYALQKNIDFIINDHHLPGDQLPNAAAILNPKQSDCSYPFKELCGCGVGFKLMQGLSIQMNWSEEDLSELLDLVAVATCSDIVPLVGENRTLVTLGIRQLNRLMRPGVRALTDIAGFKKIENVSGIVFGLGPRINAAGRMQHGMLAVQLLVSDNDEDASRLAKQINVNNSLRKDVDAEMTAQALDRIASNEQFRNAYSTVLFDPSWHKGVIGIVASRCIEKFYKPTIILTQNGEFATGSARSVHDFDIYEAIRSCEDVLTQFGGHRYAAGLTMPLQNVELFRERFEAFVSENIQNDQRIPKIDVDLLIALSDINQKMYKQIQRMAPFGPQNMEPIFVAENVEDTGQGRLLKEAHLKLFVKQGNGPVFEAIGFNMANYFERIKKGSKFNLCFSPEENVFNGNRTLQLKIKDIKFVDA